MTEKISLYHEYINKRNKYGSGLAEFKLIKDKYQIQSGLYPGSYVHITPSLVIPRMYYVDQDKKAVNFFKLDEDIMTYLNQNKLYNDNCFLSFENNDYWHELKINVQVDLLISLYAGFVSQATKKYLKIGGILLANDSHADATRAYYDPDYQLIGVIKNDGKTLGIETDNLDKYFKAKVAIDLPTIMKKMKGPKYQLSANYYIFTRIK